MSRFQVTVVVLLAIIAALGFTLVASRPAQAQVSPQAVCTDTFTRVEKGEDANSVIARWFNEQIAAGRSRIMVVPTNFTTHLSSNLTICAW